MFLERPEGVPLGRAGHGSGWPGTPGTVAA